MGSEVRISFALLQLLNESQPPERRVDLADRMLGMPSSGDAGLPLPSASASAAAAALASASASTSKSAASLMLAEEPSSGEGSS